MAMTLWHHEIPTFTAGCVFCKVLPNRIKRMIALSCLFGYIASDSFDETVALERLNREFSFCRDSEALRLPTRFAMLVRGRTIEHHISIPSERGPLYQLAMDIVSKTPASLRYGSVTQMREDILRVLRMAL